MALPVHIGIPGVIERRKLLSIAMRIGLGDSTRFLKKNTGFWGRLALPSRFTPDALVDGLADTLADERLAVAGLHINAFNQIEATEAWRAKRLAALADVAPAAAEAHRGRALRAWARPAMTFDIAHARPGWSDPLAL